MVFESLPPLLEERRIAISAEAIVQVKLLLTLVPASMPWLFVFRRAAPLFSHTSTVPEVPELYIV